MSIAAEKLKLFRDMSTCEQSALRKLAQEGNVVKALYNGEVGWIEQTPPYEWHDFVIYRTFPRSDNQ